MADSKISALTGVTADPAHEIPINAGSGLTRKVTVASIVSLAGGGGTPGGSNTQVQFNDSGSFGGDSGLTFDKTNDVLTIGGNANLVGEAANTLALRNSTNAQTLRVYNTFTDASNYERAVVHFSGSIATFETQQAGSGTARDTQIVSGSSSVWIQNSNNLRFTTSGGIWILHAGTGTLSPIGNNYDLGGSPVGLNDVRDVNLMRWIQQTETTSNPTTSDLTADAEVAIYNKADTLVFAYNNGGTMTYLKIPLDGSSTTWTHNTTAP